MNSDKPVHAAQTSFTVADNCLQVGNVSLTRLALRVGGTPFYAYDREVISAKIHTLRSVLPAQLALHYSIKANPMPAVVQHLAGLVDGLDVASAGEMQLALDTLTPSERISFAGPGKTDAELQQAVAAGVVLNLESVNELRRLQRISGELGYVPKIVLRVNPDFELKSSGLKMGGGAKQFGIDAELVPEVLAELANMDMEFLGFHIYAGSQNLNPEAIIEAHAKSSAMAIRLADIARQEVRTLNLGGGFGIPYFPGDIPLDIAPIADHLHRCLERVKLALPKATVALELGRYLVGEAGIYVTRVIDKKMSRGKCYLITDGGLHHHLAASGNFGQVLRKNYPVAVGDKMQTMSDELVSVVGPLCTPLDLLADQMPLAHAEVGDLIVVFQSGAYGYSASPMAFLSHPSAREVLV
ncbi:pyridoxal-dependent decarboxylase, exosortase A system-associated [Solimicrobium silvestre]|nr:pyridoxal-dependent decarboxylase, exosortase A system-associated [Solimicrobium silvestre]